MKKIILYLIFSFASLLTYAQSGYGYERAVIEYMEATNAKENTIKGLESVYQNMNLQVNDMHKMCEEIVEAIWPSLIKEYNAIMQEYYTLKELNEIIYFYKTPAGKKLAKYEPEVFQKVTSFSMSSEIENLIQPIFLKYANNK